MELCLHVVLPCCVAPGQKFKMCSSVPTFEHRGHTDTLLLPHLLRLSGVARVLVAALTANDMTVLGTCLIIDCHVTAFSSSTNSLVKFPCDTRFSNLEFQRFNISSVTDSFTAFLALGISILLDISISAVFSFVGTKKLSLFIQS